jgi:hemolysin III
MLINRETGRNYYDLEESTCSRDRDDCMEQLIIEQEKNCIDLKKDGRLFLEYPLYCEGQPKPICRGVLHLVCAILLPTVLLFFLRECHGSPLAIFISVCYITSNIICYGASGLPLPPSSPCLDPVALLTGLYHIFDWSHQPEIFLQKVDHCGIAILSVGTILPDAILLFGSNLSPGFPDSLGYAMASISILLCSYTCHQIMKQKPSIPLQGLVAAWWVIPFLIPNYYYMTTIEFCAMLCCCVLQGCGVYVFTHQSPDLLPSYFGYHEIFHVLITGAGLCVLICNYSIVRRYGIAYQLGQL